MMEFTQKLAAAITKVLPGTLQAWARDGLVKPSIADAKGRGSSRLYSPADLVHIAVVKILSEMSFNRNLILSLSKHLNARVTVSSTPDPWLPAAGLTMKEVYMDPSNPIGVAANVLAVTANRWTMWGFSTTAGQMLGRSSSPTRGQMPERDAVLIINLEAIKVRISKAMG